MFSHVVTAGLDPDRVVHDPVHDRIRVDSGSESLMPVLLRILGAEHRRRTVVAAFEQFQQHAAHRLIRMIEQPFVYHENAERGVLLQELRRAHRFVQRLRPSFFKIRHANIVRTDPVLAGPFGQGEYPSCWGPSIVSSGASCLVA